MCNIWRQVWMHELAALLLAVDCALSVRGNCGLIDPMKGRDDCT